MVILFYDQKENCLYICSERDKMKTVALDDPRILDYIPNDDILYVEKGHFISKAQFGEWLSGDINLISQDSVTTTPERYPQDTQSQTKLSSQYFIHPKHNGTILIQDLPDCATFPQGIMKISGKWTFVPIDDIREVLESSRQYKVLLKAGKLEVVDAEYVKKNIHKAKRKVSAADRELDRIIIQQGKAEDVANVGGIDNFAGGDVAVSIDVE